MSGGVTINDCLFHFTQINQPMGGVGASGSGAYHGEWGFDAFSKLKPVFYRSPLNRLADLYPPYGAQDRAAGKDAAVLVVDDVETPSFRARCEAPNPEFDRDVRGHLGCRDCDSLRPQ